MGPKMISNIVAKWSKMAKMANKSSTKIDPKNSSYYPIMAILQPLVKILLSKPHLLYI